MRILVYSSLLYAALSLDSSFATGQAKEAPRNNCFVLHIQKLGRIIETPATVVLLDRTEELTIQRKGETFCLPKQMAGQPLLDLSFAIESDRVYLTRIPIERFQTSWDIEVGIGKDALRKRACRITYHQGEPETGEIISPCLVPRGTSLR